MSVRSGYVERAIPLLGCITKLDEPEKSASGQMMNKKIELDKLKNEGLPYRFCRKVAHDELATRIESYDIDLLLSVARGGDDPTGGLSRRLRTMHNAAFTRAINISPEEKQFYPKTEEDEKMIRSAGRIALIDDVFTTGSSLLKVANMPCMEGEIAVAGVIWNRDDGTHTSNMPFPVESVVQKHIPLLET
ncbi:MAG: phosphoribosyltransferase [Candidatus Saccharibacteria bacterium]|nr:phosphoribosyltransferase [Candidatus Saccharibacteria bacterium]